MGCGWAKRGKRLRVPTTSQHRERLNVFGWVAPLLGQQGLVRTPKGNRDGFLAVLANLYERLRGHTIWLYVDGASWHKGDQIKEFLKTHVRLHLEYLPPYQPALNMQERVWRTIRYEATTNRYFGSLELTWKTVQLTARHWSPQKIQRLCHIL